MAKSTEQTDKRGYPSKYSPEKFVTGLQYICELICEKKAAADNTTLPIRFWRLPKWEKFFKFQIQCVNAFLKKHDERAIIRALNRSGRMWSLRTHVLKRLIDEEQTNLEREDKERLEAINKQIAPNRKTVKSKPRPQRVSKSTLSKLQDLENG